MAEIRRICVVTPVFRDAPRAIALVRALARQDPPPDTTVRIVLVDDGSGDGTAEKIDQALIGFADAKLLRLRVNQGRSIARNAGAFACEGDLLLFIDCDCLPADSHLLASHLKVMRPGVAASVGPVTGNDDGFWHRYQCEASARRARWYAKNAFYTGSSQNMMVRRDAFMACGGFDPVFRSYGFEDRDLLLRLASEGRVTWAAGAFVKHTDTLDARVVSCKMVEAGGEGARIFSARYPDAYRLLGYGILDVRKHRWLVPIAAVGHRVLSRVANSVDRFVRARGLPYLLKKWLVKSLAGLSYLVGTYEKRR